MPDEKEAGPTAKAANFHSNQPSRPVLPPKLKAMQLMPRENFKRPWSTTWLPWSTGRRDRIRAMSAALAHWILSLMADSQRARDSLFTENVGSPIVAFLLLAWSASLGQWLLLDHNPARAVAPGLASLAVELGPKAVAACGALAEGDITTWIFPEDAPNRQTLERELDALRSSMVAAADTILTWRLALSHNDGQQADRMMFSVILTADELSYFDDFAPIRTIRECMSGYQTRIQQELADREARRRASDPHGLEASQ
eukprot:s452_g15.t1